MNFQLLKTFYYYAVVGVFLLLCHESELAIEPRTGTKTSAKIMKAFLMQCPENFSSRNNIQVTIRIAVHSTANKDKNNDSFVGKIFLGELFDTNRYLACDLKAPSLVEVSIEDLVLMYPFKLETTVQATKETESVATNPQYNEGARTDNNLNQIGADKDVHTANNVKLLDDIYHPRLKPSDFLKRSDFMHTNPKDFRRDSICTKNFRKDNNKNNANNEYANEQFYGDKNQRENAFSGKLDGMNLNNNEIDNIMSNKRRDNHVYRIGYLTKNLFDDKDSWKHRKKINEHKNDFIKCVGMKNFKKIDHILCTCAANVDVVYDVDETENSDDEQSDCFQLINNVCPLGPVYNKNINDETKMNVDGRNANYGNIKLTAFACCVLLPHFYIALGKRCYHTHLVNDVLNDEKWIQITNTKVLNELPQIIKNESDDVIDETTSFLRSNIEKDEKIIENKFHRSESLFNSPKYDLYSDDGYKNKEMRNQLRLTKTKTVPLYDAVDALFKITNQPQTTNKLRNFYKKEVKPFDKDIYDPHLNIADKMQLINMINPKRPCDRDRMNHQPSFHNRVKRNFDSTDETASLTDDELDSALESYEDSDLRLEDNFKGSDDRDTKEYSNMKGASSVREARNDPFYRGEINFLANNGSNLNSTQIAENICHDHFNEFILIPFDYANEEN